MLQLKSDRAFCKIQKVCARWGDALQKHRCPTLFDHFLVNSLHGSRQQVHAGYCNSCAEVGAAAALAVQGDREVMHDDGVAQPLLQGLNNGGSGAMRDEVVVDALEVCHQPLGLILHRTQQSETRNHKPETCSGPMSQHFRLWLEAPQSVMEKQLGCPHQA